jgi:hypothetical protein
MPAIFCRPETRPNVVALPDVEVVLLESHAGTKTAGVNDPNVNKKVLRKSVNNPHLIPMSYSQKVSESSLVNKIYCSKTNKSNHRDGY